MLDPSSDCICRICLKYGATFPIFTNKEDENSVYCKLQKCLHEKVEDIIGYPKNICLECKTTLDTVSDFIQLFEESHKKLGDNLNLVKTEKVCSDDDDDYVQALDPFESFDEINSEPEEKVNTKILDLLNLPGLKITKIKQEKNEPVVKKKNGGNVDKNKKQINKTNKGVSSILESEYCFYKGTWCKWPPEEDEIKKGPKQEKIVATQKLKRATVTETVRLCEACGETFQTQEKLTLHIKNKHKSKEPIKCDECNRSYTDKCNYRAHMKRVHGAKIYICDQCSRQFSVKGYLTSHIRNVHFKHLLPKRTFKCHYCDKEFKNCKSKIIHERTVHTGDRPAECTYCDAAFSHIDYLKEHMRLHTGETPFKCPICGRGYAQRCNMKSHFRIHRLSELDETTLKKMRPNWLKLLKK